MQYQFSKTAYNVILKHVYTHIQIEGIYLPKFYVLRRAGLNSLHMVETLNDQEWNKMCLNTK